jgi:DNA-binding SARP family transcriptional activator
MQVKVLGPLEVTHNGRSVTPSASKARQTLALLALYAGQVVTVPTLMDELWGSDLPRKPLQSVQTYVLILRRMIEEAQSECNPCTAKEVLVTLHGGYMLNISLDELDVRYYEQLAASGRRAMEAGDYESASHLLRAALDVWRGPALVDVHIGNPLGVKVTGLEEGRLGVLESRIEADLRLGRHHMLLSELGELVTRFPMHENVCTQYMTALYRSGRKWRALEVFRKLRDTLVNELGLEPSRHVQHVHQAILKSDPGLEEPATWRQTERPAAELRVSTAPHAGLSMGLHTAPR